MTLFLPDGSNHTDLRTPLEKDVGVRPPGLYRADGSFHPTRVAAQEQARIGFLNTLRSHGFTVKLGADGKYDITPPYPDGASRKDRRRIDAHWRKRIEHVLSNVREA